MMRLILFDIDGTLIHINHAGRETLAYALNETFGTAGPLESYRMAGKTDLVIITDLLRAAGIPRSRIEAQLPRVYELMESHGSTIFAERGIRPCPGVPELLDRLASRSDVALGLLTGNASLTAPLKLRAAGILPDLFHVGAFGSENGNRDELGLLAIERARSAFDYPFAGPNTWIVGDTPADIRCAKTIGARSLAVATGSFSLAELERLAPDILVASLDDTDKIVEGLLTYPEEKHRAHN